MKKIVRIKWLNIILLLVTIVSIIIFVVSIINIIKWKLDSNMTNKTIESISKIVDVKEVEDNIHTEVIEQIDEVDKSNPYWDYIKMNMVDVDLTKLKSINSNTMGWLKVNGTNINYPFVQTNNNEYYLYHSFDKSYNQAGWVFLDYRNDINNLSKNTIIYAHGRNDSSMFGTLKNITKSNWYNDSNNYIVNISTEEENTMWQVFSVYIIDTTSDYLKIDFNEEEYKEFLSKIKDRSIYNFDTNVSTNDNILTLSTCYNSTQKVVMHAKLIKRSINK